jgi:drug/metabolite transporter (DMT)-like permease
MKLQDYVGAVKSPTADLRRRGQFLVTFAAIAWSVAGVLQRGMHISVATQLSARALVAFIALSAVVVYEAHRAEIPLVAFVRAIGWLGIAFALCLSGASACFIFALNRTTVANVLFLQALSPIIAVVLARIFLAERVSQRAAIATCIALVGVGVMVGGPQQGAMTGLIAAFGVAVLFAISIVFTRSAKEVSMSPASALSQLVIFLSALPFAQYTTIERPDLIRLLALGVFQMGLGQLCFITGARLLATSETALFTLLEIVLGPLWVWWFYRESPGTATLIGGAIVLCAVVFQATERSRSTVVHDPIPQPT